MDRLLPSRAPAATDPDLERLRLPWWAWPPALLMVGLLAAEVHMGFPGVRSWLPYLVLLPLGATLMWWLGRIRVGVAPGPGGEPEVWAGDAHVPVRFVGRTDVVEGEGKRVALGPDLDPTAYVLHRPWIRGAVRLEITDPNDPTPYWVVSTRRPRQFLAEVRGEHGPEAPEVPGPVRPG